MSLVSFGVFESLYLWFVVFLIEFKFMNLLFVLCVMSCVMMFVIVSILCLFLLCLVMFVG